MITFPSLELFVCFLFSDSQLVHVTLNPGGELLSTFWMKPDLRGVTGIFAIASVPGNRGHSQFFGTIKTE